jgi:cytoskeleton protein RodZ
MPAEIGATLREARMRARIDISEIEAQTKIRAKYLRALENEEWDLLPGSTFVKSFLRTYAQALSLDDKAIVEEYRQYYERPNEADLQPIVPASRQKNQSGRGAGRGGARGVRASPSRGYTIAIALVSLVIVLLVVALLTGGGSSNDKTPTTAARSATTPRQSTHHSATHTSVGTTSTTQSSVLALSVQPTAPVYVCLISATGRKLIPGLILQPSTTPTTYHSKSFTITLGNSSVKLFIDGSERTVPASSQAIGYSITKAAGRHTLPSSQQPTCK